MIQRRSESKWETESRPGKNPGDKETCPPIPSLALEMAISPHWSENCSKLCMKRTLTYLNNPKGKYTLRTLWCVFVHRWSVVQSSLYKYNGKHQTSTLTKQTYLNEAQYCLSFVPILKQTNNSFSCQFSFLMDKKASLSVEKPMLLVNLMG